jgi:hypothetical protein
MTREDFRIVSKYYATSSLTMIFFKDRIIESVEIFKNYKTFEDAADKAARLADEGNQKKAKPIKMKTSKDKRTEQEISAECERHIAKFIKENS